MAIKGLGTDIVEIARFSDRFDKLGDKLARRILTESEQAEFAQSSTPARLLAKRFAVKEAASKALGTGIGRGVSFHHIELYHDDWGAPKLRFNGGAAERLASLGANCALVSLSDEKAYVVATVIIE
ncbi:holo-ACP synthase [Ferrimonas lipolytica]|uniref:Holo-[acyl-carrier-protein] synthase n=1 Tax=Ferrimonas lipolytica TaxID=2724191 RepID=A0A6H1UH05_9GAMM|nr:holo-ACP synthase [Ferrimonas lipolytica]QIZ77496.1 holo-ACP synthase [Ferrimonas lipolytica]